MTKNTFIIIFSSFCLLYGQSQKYYTYKLTPSTNICNKLMKRFKLDKLGQLEFLQIIIKGDQNKVKDGDIFNGGDRGIPDWQFGNSRAISGRGGNIGNIGTGGGERFLRKTRFARSGDGGLPGAAIKGYDSNYVTMIYQGNILGDSNYMFQS